MIFKFNISFAQNSANEDFSVIHLTDGLSYAAKVFSKTNKRFGLVEYRSFLTENPTTGAAGVKIVSQEFASVDCSNRGFEPLASMLNLALDFNEKEPKWIELYAPEKYKKGIKSENIKHRPVELIIAEKNAMIKENKSSGIKIEDTALPWRSIEEVVVDYACSIVKDGLDPKASAEKSIATSGLKNNKQLICSIDPGEDLASFNIPPGEAIIRFNESLGYVQHQDVWLKNRRITPTKISFSNKKINYEISRNSGRIILSGGSALFQGTCEEFEGKGKF